jgi:hypothetical protein
MWHRRRIVALLALLFGCVATPGSVGSADVAPPRSLAPPDADGPFLRPAAGDAVEPMWGIKGGIAVGLWPTPGPRGLIRVYAPYLGSDRLRPINFVAVEPVANRSRGLSELEKSALDGGVAGKAMWTGDTFTIEPRPRPPWQPARGVVTRLSRCWHCQADLGRRGSRPEGW